jgi:hypothetical protein
MHPAIERSAASENAARTARDTIAGSSALPTRRSKCVCVENIEFRATFPHRQEHGGRLPQQGRML